MADDKSKPRSERIRIEQHSSVGMLWIAAWLFTIGFLELPFEKGVLALLVWPYYLGTALSAGLGGENGRPTLPGGRTITDYCDRDGH